MINRMLDTTLIYFVFALLVGIITVLVIPRKVYKHYFLYGLMFGGIGDTLTATVFRYLNLIRFKNMGVFNVLGLFSIWTPITWMFAFMLFFYFLPVRKAFLVPYILAFAGINYAIGLVMEQFGLFEFIGNYRYFAPITFITWYVVSTWVYMRNGDIKLK